ncbi:sugar-transfer associated ATP-grasp domain-containing protein [Aliiroseovarius subalbicans]|nr:sugar-transfer associated ATP-grasp domain-containing protein [Aliiroseovarius subalbicans]
MGSLSVPDWEKMYDLAISMHIALDGYGILGWDVMPTPDGPVFLEINRCPLHSKFEMEFQGLMNPTIKPLLDDALALAKARVKAAKAKSKEKTHRRSQFRV